MNFNCLLSSRLGLFALVVASTCWVQAADSPFAFREVNGGTGLELTENGKPAYVYNHGMILASGYPDRMRRSCYLHPVFAPDGTQLTDDFNRDHPHHRGIFWAWEVITVDGKTDDIWTLKGFRQKFVRWKVQETLKFRARLAVENGWFDGDQKIVKEDVEVITTPVAGNRRTLDFVLTFEATDKPVVIVGTPDDKKGYGGFAFRTMPRDGGPAKTILRTDDGVLTKDLVMSRHPWAEIAGTFGGKDEVIRIEDHPTNPGYPTNAWLMRHSYAMLNVSYPGLDPVTLVPGKPLVLKYRVILSSGKTERN